MGVGRLIGTEQRVEQGVTNAALDILSYAVNPQYARSRGQRAGAANPAAPHGDRGR
jgi:hypothetical protein